MVGWRVDVWPGCSTLATLISVVMGASRIDQGRVLPQVVVDTPHTRFQVPLTAMSLRRHGVEFRSPSPLSAWTEMRVTVAVPGEGEAVGCTGVVVACDGNRHTGYRVSLLFLSLSHQAEERLRVMAESVWS